MHSVPQPASLKRLPNPRLADHLAAFAHPDLGAHPGSAIGPHGAAERVAFLPFEAHRQAVDVELPGTHLDNSCEVGKLRLVREHPWRVDMVQLPRVGHALTLAGTCCWASINAPIKSVSIPSSSGMPLSMGSIGPDLG